MIELLIYTPDGKKRRVPLDTDRVTLGRSSGADLSFTEDSGLSRLHLAFERAGNGWNIRDLQSKNGTVVNGNRLTGLQPLQSNDKISCGHLLVVFDPPSSRSPGVTFFEDRGIATGPSTIVTSLDGILDDVGESGGVAHHLSALIQAGNELAGERPLQELFQLILDLSMNAVGACRGVLLVMENDTLVERASRGESFRISSTVRERVIDNRLSVLVQDAALDDTLRNRESIIVSRVRTLMAAPLQLRDRAIGLIYVDSPPLPRVFTRDDLNLLTVMANVATIRIEHTRLAEVEQARKLMEYELDQAAAIQKTALPSRSPQVPGFEIQGFSVPSRKVGGDYFEYFEDTEGRVGMIVADVSGKGMAAALMVMALQARVQSLFETLPHSPGELGAAFKRLNRLTAACCPDARFITAFACVLDAASPRLLCVGGGHNPAVIVRANGICELVDSGGLPLGLFPSSAYQDAEGRLESGDLLAIYSDGVTEACSPDDCEYGVERLTRVLAEHRNESAKALADFVASDLQMWTHNEPAADDMTLVIAKRL